MRKVLDEVITKNGDVVKRFVPTGRMILYAVTRAKSPTLVDKEICELTGLAPPTIASWSAKYGHDYLEWLEEMIDQFMPDKEAEMLHAVGMIESLQGNFQFWKEMAKTKGVIKEDVKNLSVTINTDFSHVVNGESFEDARKRILQSLRGVGESGKSRMAESAAIQHAGSSKSKGAGTRTVQERSVVLADPLGSDGGLSGTGQPLPAFSK